MKKTIKGLVVFSLGMVMATSTLYASGYINWKGAPEVEQINIKLDKLEHTTKGINEKEKLIIKLNNTIKELEQEIAEQDKTIEENHEYMNIYYKDNEGLQKEITRLVDVIKELEEQNDVSQAYKDVVAINERLDKILEGDK